MWYILIFLLNSDYVIASVELGKVTENTKRKQQLVTGGAYYINNINVYVQSNN